MISAKTTDNQGASATSAAVNVNVNARPTVTIAAPTNNASYAGPANVSLTANANDVDGSIAKVEFFNGTTSLGVVTAAPYTINWSNVAPGNYSITATVTDNQGAGATSAAIVINVNAPPAVLLTAQANNASYVAPATISLMANASDVDGTIAKVEFFNGPNSLGTVTSAPYTFAWTNVAQGNYNVTAVATDNQGATATSNAVIITVAANTPPTVSITTPGNNFSVVGPATIAINATASDSDGSVMKVELYEGATLLATVTQSPYSFNWNATPGSYTLFAKAVDDRGAVTTSAAVNVMVTATNVAPTVAISASPANAAAPATINLAATASDTDGSIAKVEFFNGAAPLATSTAAPYTFSWTNVPAGSYTITARATDNLGAVTTSAPTTVTITTGQLQPYFIETDHLNTPRVITNSSGQVVWKYDNNDPFGANIPNENPSGLGPFKFNLRFPGQYYDVETGLHYNNFRTYDPAGGIFTTSDPMGLLAGVNTYAYVGGNPISFVDPTGLIRHQTGKTIQCGKNCTIRIDTSFDERTGVGTRHLHWDCRGDTGSCGENGGKSHGGSWEDAPAQVKQCALNHGFNGAPASNSSAKEIWGAVGIGALVVGGIILAPEITIPTLLLSGALAK